MNQLEIKSMTLQCGPRTLRVNDLRVEGGVCLTLAGANGVGKTSFLRAVCGLRYADEITLKWNGETVDLPDAGWSSACSYIGHADAMQASLTAAENLVFYAALKRRALHAASGEVGAALARFDMRARAAVRCAAFSAGQMRRLSLCRLALEETAVWLLDEPATSLDAHGRAALEACVAQHLAGGGVAIVATHQPLDLGDATGMRLDLCEHFSR